MLPTIENKSLNRVFFTIIFLLCGAIQTAIADGDRVLADKIEKDIYQLMDTYRVSGLAVSIVRDQEVILSRGFGIASEGKRLPVTRTTHAELYSATKLLTAVTILALDQRDLFDINTPLGKLLNDVPGEWESIPFWRLLNHTSGITTIIDKPEFDSLIKDSKSTDRNVFKLLKTHPLDYPPGQYSRYRQSGYAIASMIISEQLGMPWPDIVKKYLTDPARMENTVHRQLLDNTSADPMLASAGGYLTTPEDMANFFRALSAGKIIPLASLKTEMLNPERVEGNYSLGAIVETYGDEPTIGHQGGGARANIRYALDDKVGIAVFTDQQDNYQLAIELTDKILGHMVAGQPLEKSKQPIAIRLADYRDQPPEKIISFYKQAKIKHRDKYNFSEAETAFNSLGYYLLQNGKVNDAIAILKFNAEEYPESANTYDSLGEAYLADGNIEKAKKNYQKSLELDQGNQNAVDMLNTIESAETDHTRN